jgi:hypothetical protein
MEQTENTVEVGNPITNALHAAERGLEAAAGAAAQLVHDAREGLASAIAPADDEVSPLGAVDQAGEAIDKLLGIVEGELQRQAAADEQRAAQLERIERKLDTVLALVAHAPDIPTIIAPAVAEPPPVGDTVNQQG